MKKKERIERKKEYFLKI